MIEKFEAGKLYYDKLHEHLIKVLDDEDAPVYYVRYYDFYSGQTNNKFQFHFRKSDMYEVDPKLADKFDHCFNSYKASISALHKQVKEQISNETELPPLAT